MKPAKWAASMVTLAALGCVSHSSVQHSSHDAGEIANNAAESIEEFIRAAEGGDPGAQSRLAFAFETGRGVPVDPAAAVEWHRRAAKQGEVASQAALGRALLNGVGTEKQQLRGLHWLRQAAWAGEPNAQAQLGAAFLHGIGRARVRVNRQKAEKWLHAASEQGIAQAQYDLATLYYDRDDDELGLEWLREAVGQDLPQAHSLLSARYREGRGVPLDDVESLRLLRRAAELGDREAQNEYGLVLRAGHRVERNYRESFKWFERSALGGDIDAQFNLGLAYFYGTGVERDGVRAVAWFEVCRDETHRDAIRQLGSARGQLTAEQLEAAKRLQQEIAAELEKLR